MPPVVRDGGVANGVFTCRTDDREGIIFPEPGSQIGFGSGAGESPGVRSGLNDRGPFVDQKDGRLVRLARDDQRVESRLLTRNGETAAGQRVIQQAGKRAATDHSEFRGCGQRTSDQGAEAEDDG